MIASLVIAVVAVAVAIGAWFRPAGDASPPPVDPTPQYSEQEVAQAKEAICDAYTKTTEALGEASGSTSEDPNVKYMIAVNTRLAIHANASYLRESIRQNPAAPPEFTDIFREMASAYDAILMAQLAGTPSEAFNQMNVDLDAADAKATEACK